VVVSLQVTRVINPAVGCHYFPPGPQLPPQLLRGLLYQFRWLVNRGTMGVTVCLRLLPGCNLNPGPSATESSTPTTRLPSMICVLIISMPAQQELSGRSTVSRAFLSRRNKYRGTLTTVGPARVCVSVLIRAIWVRISEHARTENGRAIQRCSPKKEVGGRLKQDLDKDF